MPFIAQTDEKAVLHHIPKGSPDKMIHFGWLVEIFSPCFMYQLVAIQLLNCITNWYLAWYGEVSSVKKH